MEISPWCLFSEQESNPSETITPAVMFLNAPMRNLSEIVIPFFKETKKPGHIQELFACIRDSFLAGDPPGGRDSQPRRPAIPTRSIWGASAGPGLLPGCRAWAAGSSA
jgi:hypothetical protein